MLGTLETFQGFSRKPTTWPGRLAQGRLTSQQGVAVPTADQTAVTTLYYTPCTGNLIELPLGPGGPDWRTYEFDEVKIPLTISPATMYDINCWADGGRLRFEFKPWGSTTARANGAYDLALRGGVYVSKSEPWKRYLGSIYSDGTTNQTEDSADARLIWNYYNQTARQLHKTDGSTTWTYSTNTYRSWNNSNTNRVEFVLGLDQLVDALFLAAGSNTSSGSFGVGIDLDGTATNDATSVSAVAALAFTPIWARWQGYPGAGYHYLQMLEIGGASGTTTFLGVSPTGSTLRKSAMSGVLIG